MSWRVLLSEYPKSILRDGDAIGILALIELEGLSTEADLQKSTEYDRLELTKALLRLYQNSLISYSGAYIQLTERGRGLLDRFDLSDAVVVTVLKKLCLPQESEQFLRTWILRYRKESLEDYLLTVRTCRSWSGVSSQYRHAEHRHTLLDSAGCVAILCDDLRTWVRNRKVQDQSGQELRLLTWIDNIDRLKFNVDTTHLSIATSFLREYENFAARKDRIDSLKEARPDHFIFLYHHCSRASLQPQLWASEWEASAKCRDWVTNLPKYTTFVSTLLHHATSCWADDWEGRAAERRHSHALESAIRRNVGDLLVSVLSAETFDDLLVATQINRDSLSKLLQHIQIKIEKFLQESVTPTGKGGDLGNGRAVDEPSGK